MIILFFFRHKSAPSSPMVMRAFSRLGSSLSARWDRSFKKQDSQSSDENENLRRWQSDFDCKSLLSQPIPD